MRITLRKWESWRVVSLLEEDVISTLKERAKQKIEEGKIKHAIEILKDVIFLLRKEKRDEEADLLELTMNQYIMELSEEEWWGKEKGILSMSLHSSKEWDHSQSCTLTRWNGLQKDYHNIFPYF